MKRIVTVTFIAGMMGIAGLSGLACSMEKLEESAPEVVAPEVAHEPKVEAVLVQKKDEVQIPDVEEDIAETISIETRCGSIECI